MNNILEVESVIEIVYVDLTEGIWVEKTMGEGKKFKVKKSEPEKGSDFSD